MLTINHLKTNIKPKQQQEQLKTLLQLSTTTHSIASLKSKVRQQT